jgi:murein L,D-transpeptidase YafK
MRLITRGRQRPALSIRAAGAALALAALVAACSSAPEIPPAEQPLSKEALMLLGKKGMDAQSPIFIRIFKEDSELEVWKARDDGRFYHFKTYPICNWSGELGPKTKQGDKQAPEGFYRVSNSQMNPNSQFYLAFNLGYPNAYDRSQGRTGDFLMVHGKCKSAGCYAMTDALIEEIYALAREALKGGQQSFEVHAFPFRMTEAKMAQHKKHPWYPFWQTLKQGYDHFETHRVPPTVAVCERRYIVNVKMPASRVDAEGPCPAFERPQFEPFVPKPAEQQMAEERISVPGPKMRTAANIGTATADQLGYGLTTGGIGGASALGGSRDTTRLLSGN